GHEARRPVRLTHWVNAGATGVAISADGRWVLSAGSEERLLLHDAATGKEVCSIPLPQADRGEVERRFFDLRISRDGKRATGLFGARAHIGVVGQPAEISTDKLATWDLTNGHQLVRVRPVEYLSNTLSPDGRTLLSGSRPALIDVASGKEMVQLEGMRQASRHGENEFSGDGALMVGQVTEETNKDGMIYVSPA